MKTESNRAREQRIGMGRTRGETFNRERGESGKGLKTASRRERKRIENTRR